MITQNVIEQKYKSLKNQTQRDILSKKKSS